MSKYIVESIVCDWAIYSIDDYENKELVEVCNSKANAELICEILNADLFKDGQYKIWKDQKIADLEAKLEESKKKASENYQEGYELYLSLKQFYSRLGVEAYPDDEIQDVAVKELNRLLKENEELKAKLADSEKALEYARYPVARILDDLDQLKQQLAEKDEEIKQLKFQSAVDEDWSITHRTRITELEDELNEVESFMKNYGFDSLDELKEYYVNLLELKDWLYDRIDGTENDESMYTDYCSGQCNAYYKVLDKLDELYKSNQNQTAIAELEKLKEKILKIDKTEIKTLKNGYSTLYVDRPETITIIDQQIKLLKGE